MTKNTHRSANNSSLNKKTHKKKHSGGDGKNNAKRPRRVVNSAKNNNINLVMKTDTDSDNSESSESTIINNSTNNNSAISDNNSAISDNISVSDNSSEISDITSAKELMCDEQNTDFLKLKLVNKQTATMTEYNVKTGNKFNALAQDNNEEYDEDMEDSHDPGQQHQQQEKSRSKPPPPIVLHGQPESHAKLTEVIKKFTNSEYSVKYTKFNVNITINDRNERNKLINHLKNSKTEFHTYSDSNEKTHAFVVRGLANDVTPEELTEELTTLHSLPVVKCYKITAKNRPNNLANALFLLVTKNNVTLKGISQKIKYALHTRIYFERRHNTKRISQCHTCQGWGHATSNCHAKVKCMYCAEGHHTKECKPTNKIKCSNCGDKHQSNDLNCPAYINKIQWLNANQTTHQNQNYNHRESDYPPIYKPAPPPTQNAWKLRNERAQQSHQQHHQQQQSNQTQQNQPQHPQQTSRPQPPRQHQQSGPQRSDQEQHPRQQPRTYAGRPPMTFTQPMDAFQEMTSEFATLNQLVNLSEIIRAVRDLNDQLKNCHTKQDKFFTFTQFTQNIQDYDI